MPDSFLINFNSLNPFKKSSNFILSILSKCSASFNDVYKAYIKFNYDDGTEDLFEYDFSDDKSGLYDVSKPIELTLEANDGKFLLIDNTNGKTYEGTYEAASGRFGKFRAFTKKSYTVVIDGLQGTASFSSNRTLFVSIGGYYLNFEIK